MAETTGASAPSAELDSLADRVEIAPGVLMPRLGFGTSRAPGGGEVEREVAAGLELGYRLIDTAAMYGNERAIGAALRTAEVPREEVFLTTKVWNSDQGYDSTLRAFDASLARLGLDYVDLYLVHWPQRSRTADTWRALEELLGRGLTRAIGVSNFERADLDVLFASANVPPALNQLELHPLRQRVGLEAECRERGITVQAWSPIMQGAVNEIPALVEIGRRHSKTAVQVTLRWILQRGVSAIPKSVHEDRLRQNADVYDFSLSDEEMLQIRALDKGEPGG